MNRLKRLLSYLGNAVIYSILAFCLKSYILKKVIGEMFTNTDAFFSLVLVKNNGAAFNLFAGFQDWLVIFAAIIILAIIGYLLVNKLFVSENFLMMLSLFTAGIAGNAIERYTLGYVEDFIKINLFNFPVFNLNDIMITVAAVVIALSIVNDKRREIQENKDAEDDLIYGD